MRLLQLFSENTYHLGIDDLESHAWVLIWEFITQCRRHGIPLSGLEVSWIVSMDASVERGMQSKSNMCSFFIRQSSFLSTAMKTMVPIMQPWLRLAETALTETGSPEGAMTQDQFRDRDLHFYQEYLSAALRPGVLESLPETWAELKNLKPSS
jgi:hypothetical protein